MHKLLRCGKVKEWKGHGASIERKGKMLTRKPRKEKKKPIHVPSVEEKRAQEFSTAVQVEMFKALKDYRKVFELEAKYDRSLQMFEFKVAADDIHPDHTVVEKVRITVSGDGKANREVIFHKEVVGDHIAFCDVYDPIKLCSE